MRNIATISAGQGAPQGDSNYCEDGTPFVKAGNLAELLNGKPINTIQKVSESVAKQHRFKLFPKGTVLFAKSGMSCLKGYVYVLPVDAYVVSHLACVTTNIEMSSYLRYFFNYHKPNKLVKDEAYPSISLEDIGDMTIDVKTDKEREYIVSVLDHVVQLIKLRQQQLLALDTLIKARFVEMFGDPDTNPKSWPEKLLSDMLDVIGGYAFKSDGFSEVEGIPVLRIGNINAGFFKPVNMVFWEEDKNLERYIMYPGDLVMSLTGTVGKDDYGNVCILGNDYSKYYLNQRNAKLELKEGLDKHYLSQLLRFDKIKKRLTGISRGVRQANISNRDILGLRVPIPPIELQEQFAFFVSQVDKSKAVVQAALNKTQMLFDSLMQQYFG